MGARGSTVVGTILIMASVPAMVIMAGKAEGLAVVAVGIVAYAILGAGLWLARDWLAISQSPARDQAGQEARTAERELRKREPAVPGPAARSGGCLSMIVTLLALLSAAGITYYVVFYGAWQMTSGSGK